MPHKACPKCGETVEEAKAFCPACGHSFVEEQQRTGANRYDQADHTMQMGQTMYNSMLSDMGLNLKKDPEKRIEVLKPAVQAQELRPVSETPAARPPAMQEERAKKSNKKVWVITISVAVVLLLIFAVAVIAIALYLYYSSGRF
jgi:uncharacterized membrane protein YvbJ